MFDVFISYSSHDKDTAARFCRALEAKNMPCWMAPRDIPAGSHWAASIVQALRNAKAMLLLLSTSANDSQQVAREVDLAAANRLPIIPILFEGVHLNDMLQYYLSVCHRLESETGDESSLIDQTVKTLKSLLQPTSAIGSNQSLPAPQRTRDQILDIYDRDMNQIGTATRGGVHREGLWHKTYHCWFIKSDEEGRYLWVQQRSMDKDDFPGLMDITAARHLSAGETDREGLGRIVDELGVPVDFEQTKFLGIRTYEEHIDDFYNREFNSVYLFPTEFSLGDLCLRDDEVYGVFRLRLENAAALFRGDLASISAVGRVAGQSQVVQKTITINDFVPRTDDYYSKLCLAIDDFYAGRVVKQL